MLYLVSYDIEADVLRLALARHLLEAGLERVQRSVFVGPLSDLQHRQLLDWLTYTLPDTQSVHCMVLPLPAYTVDESFCRGQPSLDWTYLAGEAHTLIL